MSGGLSATALAETAALGLAGSLVTSKLFGANAPASSGAPAAEVTQQSAASQDQQTAELATAGAGAGEVLQPDQVQQRNTLFGN